jgi:hypothetical protein
MLEESPVLHRQHGVDQVSWDLLQVDRPPPRPAAHGEHDAIGRGQIEGGPARLLQFRGQQQPVGIAERDHQTRHACAEQQHDGENSGPPGFASHASVTPRDARASSKLAFSKEIRATPSALSHPICQ